MIVGLEQTSQQQRVEQNAEIKYGPAEKLTMAICGHSEADWQVLAPDQLNQYSGALLKALDTLEQNAILDGRQKQILVDNFGLSGEPSKKLAKIAKELGVTTSRIQTLEQNALTKLRHHPLVAKLIAQYYDIGLE